jgi:hypothetical protein
MDPRMSSQFLGVEETTHVNTSANPTRWEQDI